MRCMFLLVSCVAWGQAWYPAVPDLQNSNIATSANSISATGHKWAACGQVWNSAAVTKSIRKVGFLFASPVTKAGGSALTLSLQDVSLTSGPPSQPDGVQDQTVAIPNASIAASTFFLTGALSSDRSVVYGEYVCVVIEYDGAGRLGSDTIALGSYSRNGNNPATTPSSSLFTTAWASNNRVPVILFEFSDGTYGTLDGAFVFSAMNVPSSYNVNSAFDELALKFNVDVGGTMTGVAVSSTVAAGADYDIVLYSGTTQIASISIDANTQDATVSSNAWFAFPPTTLTAGNTYYLSVKPTTTNNVTIGGSQVAANSYLGGVPQGVNWFRATRVDGGAWTDANTFLPAIRFRYTTTAGGGGGTGGSYVVAQ